MTAPCGGDPLVCIEFVVWAIGEFLKNWPTMAMLAVLLGLLLRLRADRRVAREQAYIRQIDAYERKRSQDAQTRTWAGGDDQTGER